MRIFVLFGQRECDYPGQYAPEALECIDENGNSDNPDFLVDQKAKYENSGEFDSLAVVQLSLPGEAVDNALYPDLSPVKASVEHDN